MKTTLKHARQAIDRELGLAPTESGGQQVFAGIVGDDRPKSLDDVTKQMNAERRAKIIKVYPYHRISPRVPMTQAAWSAQALEAKEKD
jgi:hypothetical protein